MTTKKMAKSQPCVGIAALILAATQMIAQQTRLGRGPSDSPAAQRPTATGRPQSYTTSEIEAGQSRFVSQCGFCHGRDAQGGESGPDLTRSELVAEDERGDKLGPVILSGRPDKGMPAFAFSKPEVISIAAFIHDAKSKSESVAGGRRTVEREDLQTGNAEAGKRYFNGAGGCANCHSLSGSFATVGSRLQGLALLQRMLNPGRGRGALSPPVIVTAPDGQKIAGRLAYQDEFMIAVIDADGWSHSWPAGAMNIEENPLQAHAQQLGRYTDQEIHDVFAYLQTLK